MTIEQKWDINKVEAMATKFGTGAHITLPKTWLKKIVVAVTKDTLVMHFCIQEDNSFLEEKLAYLRSVDAIR